MSTFRSCIRCCALFAVLLAAPSLQAAAREAVLPNDVSLESATHVLNELGQPLRSPMPGAEISSGFGWRHHPVLRRTRFHAGVDFLARSGTPVLAAGDGVVERIERHRDRGLYVVIRHGERVLTGYAHLRAVREGLSVGEKVNAQQPIAYVGRSGRTTGAHLDFEVFCDGLRVNPEQVLAAADSVAPETFGSGKFVTFRELAE